MVPEFYNRDEQGIPTAWVAKMRVSMARLAPHYSSNRSVREYTEQYYLPAAAAFRERSVNKGAIGLQIVDWRNALEQKWEALRFGEMQVKTDDKRHVFEVQVHLDGLDPEAVRVELYADGVAGSTPIRQKMKRERPLEGSANGFVYSVQAPADRLATDYTARLVPYYSGLALPLEETHILWQR